MSDDVFSAADLATPIERATATVHLAGLGKTLRLRAWSAEVGLKVESLAEKAKAGSDPTEFFATMVVPSVIDRDGKAVFTAPTFKTFLAKMSRDDLFTLIKAIGELNKRQEPAAGEVSPPTDA